MADTLLFHAEIQILKIVKHGDLFRLRAAIQLLMIPQKDGVVQDKKIGNLINIKNDGSRTVANEIAKLIKNEYLFITTVYINILMQNNYLN
ncbi:MAG: hypothetical protein P8N11_07715 [Gammaproteobacteria bacterium]|nr:hypothetical protein [Gammaproteobacteria bacterium]